MRGICLVTHPPPQPIRAIALHARNYRLAPLDLTITALKAYSVLLLLLVVTLFLLLVVTLFLQNVDHPPKPQGVSDNATQSAQSC